MCGGWAELGCFPWAGLGGFYWGESGFNCWVGVRGPAIVSFLFYMNVSEMRPKSRLLSQLLILPAPWVLLHIR